MGGGATRLAVGVVGLGAMGAGMAQSLRRAVGSPKDDSAVIKIFPGFKLPEKKA